MSAPPPPWTRNALAAFRLGARALRRRMLERAAEHLGADAALDRRAQLYRRAILTLERRLARPATEAA